MLYQEIMSATAGRETATIREAFRRLIDFPHEGPIHAAGAGPLVVALRAVCEALAGDDAVNARKCLRRA
ncbi:hypothetical protein [Labrys monachus]|uniref:Uncharacterized protein n=1 Tax=Labrys monachus TaxID=217067 RepID=A0ABU0FKN3_9HYPH|nr:hypothetical protein [Labrys monachus]MDQ0395172.1 hypothetical protein [Labrys monachus]